MVLLSLVALLSGCSFFSRAKNTFYSLETIPPVAPLTAAGHGVPVGIDAIELPPGLDRRDVVVRGANRQIEVRGTNQWTASLQEMVLHTLAFDLADRLPEGMVVLPGQPKPAGTVRSVSVAFEELAPGPDPVFVLDARWTIAGSPATAPTHHERITVPLSSMDSAQVATAMSQALATLADRMATALR